METQQVVDEEEEGGTATQVYTEDEEEELLAPYFLIVGMPKGHVTFGPVVEVDALRFDNGRTIDINRYSLLVNAYSRNTPVATASLNEDNTSVTLTVGKYAATTGLKINSVLHTTEGEIVTINIGDRVQFLSKPIYLCGALSEYELVGPPDFTINTNRQNSTNRRNIVASPPPSSTSTQYDATPRTGQKNATSSFINTASSSLKSSVSVKINEKRYDLKIQFPETMENLVLPESISETTTYSEVWNLIAEEFDDEDLPPNFKTEDYYFFINTSRITKKQEKRRKVFPNTTLIIKSHKRKLRAINSLSVSSTDNVKKKRLVKISDVGTSNNVIPAAVADNTLIESRDGDANSGKSVVEVMDIDCNYNDGQMEVPPPPGTSNNVIPAVVANNTVIESRDDDANCGKSVVEIMDIDCNYNDGQMEMPPPPPPKTTATATTTNVATTAKKKKTIKRSRHSNSEDDSDNEFDGDDNNDVSHRTRSKKQKVISLSSDEEDEEDDNVVFVTGVSSAPAYVDTNHVDVAENNTNTCIDTLRNLKAIIDKPDVATAERKTIWAKEIDEITKKALPKTTIGVLGNTGVGKSSLLNALLNEASILPTSGSRGCTAAVVELRYNYKVAKMKPNDQNIFAYEADVEFMKKEDWLNELKTLISECCTNDGFLYGRKPDENAAEMAHAAWEKIEQVYGRGSLDRHTGDSEHTVLNRLSTHRIITELLTPDEGKEFKVVTVREGAVEYQTAQKLLSQQLDSHLREEKKNWAQTFRNEINSYVYRKGNGNEPQSWPLIRKVVVRGLFNVLSTGACLVDLPGVKDSNAARANVAQTYLQNCSCIWIVAKIGRAVDDGTAKDLLGEQFKRRLLMDGQYGNVSFICTQSDMCEPTEIWRDHNDVSQRTPERHAEMEKLFNELFKVDDDLLKLDVAEEKMQDEYNDLIREQKSLKRDIKKLKREKKRWEQKIPPAEIIQKWWREVKVNLIPREEPEEEEKDEGEKEEEEAVVQAVEKFTTVEDLIKRISNGTEAFNALSEVIEKKGEELDDLAGNIRPERKKLKRRQKRLNKELKPLCALVRNEYSTQQLQSDFRSGLEDMMRGPDAEEMDDDDDGNNDSETVQNNPLPDDFQLPVFCISANDYLKVTGIKSSSDGAANTFKNPTDTNIPLLRSHVHALTATRREFASKNILVSTSNIVDQIKLYINDVSNIEASSGSSAIIFESEMKILNVAAEKIVGAMTVMIEKEVSSKLKPSVEAGANRGKSAALNTVQSWGSKNKRSKKNTTSDHSGEEPGKGLPWSTYFATVRRNGEFVSGSFGNVDFNQDLCEPVEKAFMVGWERTMNAALNRLLLKCEKEMVAAVKKSNTTMFNKLLADGVSQPRLTQMYNASMRTIETVIKAEFQTISNFSTEAQRSINRSLLPQIKEAMQAGYESAAGSTRGSGLFNRIKSNMTNHAEIAVNSMFIDATKHLLNGISTLINDLAAQGKNVGKVVEKKLSDVYTVLWERGAVPIDEATKVRIKAARRTAIPKVDAIRNKMNDLMDANGCVREEPELEIQAVQDVDQVLQNQLEDATKKGDVIDLSGLHSNDDNSDVENIDVKPDIANIMYRVIPRLPNGSFGLNLAKGKTSQMVVVQSIQNLGNSDCIPEMCRVIAVQGVDVRDQTVDEVGARVRSITGNNMNLKLEKLNDLEDDYGEEEDEEEDEDEDEEEEEDEEDEYGDY